MQSILEIQCPFKTFEADFESVKIVSGLRVELEVSSPLLTVSTASVRDKLLSNLGVPMSEKITLNKSYYGS